MMKKVLIGIVVATMATIFVERVFSTTECTNEIMMANIEALATSEYNTPSVCRGEGTATCPYTGAKVKYVLRPYNLE